MPRKTMQPDARREQFIKSARELFNEKGFESTSVEDIVQKVGTAKGLFYYYFDSKDEILNILIEKLTADMKEAVMAVSRMEGKSAMERLEALFDASAEIKADSQSVVSYFHKPQNRHLHLDLERQNLEYIVPVLEEIIEQGIDEGIFDVEHPRETAIIYLAAASALGHRTMTGATEDGLVQLVEVFQDISERLFGAKPGTFGLYRKYLKEMLERRGLPEPTGGGLVGKRSQWHVC